MTRERIEDFGEVLLPFVKRRLLGINYENRGKSDAEEFEKDFNAILELAIKALEQEPILDKISAEIDELYSYVEFDEEIKTSFNMVRLEEVQRVIDKYKAESEE